MADKKITQLPALSQAASTDVFPIADIDAGPETKKITTANLFASPQPIGSVNPSTGEFTTLELPTGATISQFSTNTNLGTSDAAVPTQNAVKSYVDSQISGLAPNRIWQGDSSVTVVDSTTTAITFRVDNSVQAVIDSTGLTLASGVAVNEISNDPTLADASPTTLITEYAAKAYADSITGTGVHNQLSGLQGGDSTNEYYHLTEYLYNNLYSSGLGIGFGDSTATTLFINPSTSTTTATADQVAVLQLSSAQQILGEDNVSTLTLNSTSATIEIGGSAQGIFDSTGLTLASGVTINEISDDITLAGNSNSVVPTERAIKTYVDNTVSTSNLNVRTVYTDSTAANGDALFVDTTAGVVNIELQPANNSRIIVKKITSDGNTVVVTVVGGLIDNMASKTISAYLESITCIGDGTDYYIT